jgi:poly(3-hydroxybutyrate) depolymerase
VQERREGDAESGRQRAEKLVRVCSSGFPVVHWQLHGVGHGWPGATGRTNERLVGAPTALISAAEEVWGFVSRFSRQNGL